jgi:hypothetical protein
MRLYQILLRGQATQQTLFDLERLYILHARAILVTPEDRDPFNELDAIALNDLLARGRRGPEPTAPSRREKEQVDRERAEAGAILERLG